MMNESPEAKAVRQEASRVAHLKLMEKKKLDEEKKKREFEEDKGSGPGKAKEVGEEETRIRGREGKEDNGSGPGGCVFWMRCDLIFVFLSFFFLITDRKRW